MEKLLSKSEIATMTNRTAQAVQHWHINGYRNAGKLPRYSIEEIRADPEAFGLTAADVESFDERNHARNEFCIFANDLTTFLSKTGIKIGVDPVEALLNYFRNNPDASARMAAERLTAAGIAVSRSWVSHHCGLLIDAGRMRRTANDRIEVIEQC